MSRFRAVVPSAPDEAHRAPLLREAESFISSHGTCMRCKASPSRVVMTRGDRRIAVCGPCRQSFDALPVPTRRDDPAAARARAERARRMLAVVSRM